MAKKKLNARQRDIQRLTTQYQSQLSALAPEYESVFQKKEAAIQAGSGQAGEYAKKLEEFNKQLAAYKAAPLESLTIGRGTATGVDRSGPASAATVKIQPNKEYDWRSQTMYRIPELGNNYYTPYALEQLGYEVNPDAGGGLTQAFKRKTMPTFTEAAPEQVDLSQFDKETEAVEAKKKTLGEGFQREVAERKASRVGAVSRRAQSRPMMAKGVTL
jgi:hypothetical protein